MIKFGLEWLIDGQKVDKTYCYAPEQAREGSMSEEEFFSGYEQFLQEQIDAGTAQGWEFLRAHIA